VGGPQVCRAKVGDNLQLGTVRVRTFSLHCHLGSWASDVLLSPSSLALRQRQTQFYFRTQVT
jgi:hypothetical protein